MYTLLCICCFTKRNCFKICYSKISFPCSIFLYLDSWVVKNLYWDYIRVSTHKVLIACPLSLLWLVFYASIFSFQLKSAYAIAKLRKGGYSKQKFYAEAVGIYKEVCFFHNCRLLSDHQSLVSVYLLHILCSAFDSCVFLPFPFQINTQIANGGKTPLRKLVTEHMYSVSSFTWYFYSEFIRSLQSCCLTWSFGWNVEIMLLAWG